MSSATRVWLYDRLHTCEPVADYLGITLAELKPRVIARQSQLVVPQVSPFFIYGLGNLTNEELAEDTDHIAQRQFFQVWIHDKGNDYSRIDDLIPLLVRWFTNQTHPPANISGVHYLETSQEFDNQTYKTIFRYIRFQAIISKGERVPA